MTINSSVTEARFPPLRRQAVLIVNTQSRRGKELFREAQIHLRDAGVEILSAKSFKSMSDLVQGAKRAIDDETPMLIAGGGDGTFNAICDEFVGKQTVLGVLPLGTGNAFARDLQIPVDLREACKVIAEGTPTQIDLGWANGSYFVNVATLGLTTKIAQSLSAPLKKRFGKLVYVAATLRAWRNIVPFRVILETENGRREFDTLQLVIGNGRYHAGPLLLSPDSTITDGTLSLYALESRNKADLLRLALGLPTGSHTLLPQVHFENCSQGRIITVPPLPVTIDGEIQHRTPLEFRAAPKAIRVITPTS